jgi:hypothetical protein
MEKNRSTRASGHVDARTAPSGVWCVIAALLAIGCPASASAQPSGQLWITSTATWLATDRLQIRVEFEPRDQFLVHDDRPTFVNTNTTPRLLYVVAPWIDVLGEIDFGTKDQSNDDDSTSVTPRAGVQLHILSRLLGGGGDSREHAPRLRWNFVTLHRLEAEHRSAAESVREGLEETLTVLGLNLPDTLRRSLTTSNAAESLISRTRHVKRNVKRWRGGQMVVRWVAAGVLEAVKGFR